MQDAAPLDPFAAETPRPLLRYDGTIGGLYRVFLINLLLTIVTLGIWRFWGVTRMRRYVWSHTSMEGDRFEYDGTGGQLFVSFLLAGLVLLGILFGSFLLAAVLVRIDRRLAVVPIVLAYGALLVLGLAAPFSAQRYRLGHTLWRGIRGGMEGSPLAYGLRALGYTLLILVTLYQAVPWSGMRLRERLINASFLGSLRFSARGNPRALYRVYLLTFLACAVIFAVLGGLVWSLAAPAIHAMLEMQVRTARHLPVDPDTVRQAGQATWYFIGFYLVFGVIAACLFCAYTAAFWRNLLAHMRLGGLAFQTDVTAGQVLRLTAGNLAIVLFTLGLGQPVALHRWLRFLSTHLRVTGILDTAAIAQSSRPQPTLGEGMFQQLDAGAGLL